METIQDLRRTIVLTMAEAGIKGEVHHHEMGAAGQAEIEMKYNSMV